MVRIEWQLGKLSEATECNVLPVAESSAQHSREKRTWTRLNPTSCVISDVSPQEAAAVGVSAVEQKPEPGGTAPGWEGGVGIWPF